MFRILNKNLPKYTKEDYKKMSPFVINQWLSNSPSTAFISVFLNKNIQVNGQDPLPMDKRIMFIRELIPKNISITYPKKIKKNNEYINYISKYYKVNIELAEKYLSIMSDKQANEIKDEVKILEKRGAL